MSIATRFVSSTARPRLDLSGCVLYAPLWRPDLGGNTFTTIGDGGITTHLCTVTGATYGYQGRTFDEVDDKITTPVTTPITLTTQFGIGLWIKRGTDTANRTVIQARTGGNSWQLNVNTNGVGKIYFSKWTASVEDAASTSTGTIALNAWAFVFFTYDSVAGSVTYFNGVVDRTDAISGVIDSAATTLDFGTACGSVIGKYIIYNNRVPSAQLVQQIYLETKRRYV